MRPVATLASAGAPWLLPMIGIGLFLHKHFICHESNPADARAKAVARAKAAAPPKIKRKAHKQGATASPVLDHVTVEDQEQQLADAVMGQAWFTEDEVDALHQAEANPQALLDLLQQYGGRMVAEGLLEEGNSDDDDDDSMWYTDDPDNSWQHDSPSPEGSRHLQAQPQLLVTRLQADGTNRRPGSPDPSSNNTQQQQEAAAVAGHEFLARLAAAVQQQRQQQGDAASQNGSDASDAAAAAYFDNSYFGLPTDASAAPKDLQELQVAVSKNLEALLPRDGTWTGGSYPPRFDEMLSPYAERLEPPEPDFDFDLDPGFEYVPDFDFDPEFDDDMFGFDVDFEA